MSLYSDTYKFVSKIGIWFAFSLVFVMLSITTMQFLQTIEYKYFPVVKEFRIDITEHLEDRSLIYGTMNKVRDCRFIEMVTYSNSKLLGVYFDKPIVSRLVGIQEFGPITVKPNSVITKIVSRHSCHGFWDSTTVLLGK